jgi:hypothetical protein
VLLQISISGKHYCASVPGDVVWLLSRLLPENVIGNRFIIMHMLSSRYVALCALLFLNCVFTAAAALMARNEQHDAAGESCMVMHMLSSRCVAYVAFLTFVFTAAAATMARIEHETE